MSDAEFVISKCPKQVKDLTHQTFNWMDVLGFFGCDKSHSSLWVCRCHCGNYKVVLGRSLIREDVKSCGCLSSLLKGLSGFKHGGFGTPEYGAWRGIIQRCTNPNNCNYYKYGKRGIGICDRWKEFVNFRDDMGKRPSPKHSMDRIDNEGNYEPGNCRWATKKQQSRNRRNSHLIEYQGQVKCLTEWSEIFSINPSTLTNRIRKGWPIQDVFNNKSYEGNSPVKRKPRKNKCQPPVNSNKVLL